MTNTYDLFSLTDCHSAIDEYFNLKQRLCLTEEERLYITYIAPRIKRELEKKIKIQNIKELVSTVREYKKKYHLTLNYMGELIGIHYKVLDRILLEQAMPQPKTIEKLKEFVRYYVWN